MSKKRQRRPASANDRLTLSQARKQTHRHPTDPDAWLALARLQAGQKEFDEARASLEKARKFRPSHHEQEEWLGHVAHKQHRLQDALQHLREAQALEPDSTFGLVTLASLYLELGGPQQALEYAQQAWQAEPKNMRVMDVLASSLSALYRYDEAIQIFDHLTDLAPDQFVHWNNAGNMRRELGLLDEAYRCYQKASELAPHNAIAYSNHLTALHYDPRASRAEIAAFAKSWEKRFAPKADALPSRPIDAVKSYQRPLNVGLLSDGFRKHPVGKMIVRCLENLPQNQLELVAYTSSEVNDSLTRRIKPLMQKWRSIRHLSDDDLIQLIREDEIDILIDLSGHNAGTRMRAIAMQPAPLIVKWVGGLINTTGVQAIDYLISDHVETPEGEDEYYTEKLIRLPGDYIVFEPPEDLPALGELPAKRNGYVTLACFNNPTKLNDVTLKQWASIMHELPDSRLMLKGRPYTSASFCERLYTTLENAGIARERLIVEGPGTNHEMLDAYNRADIALDPWPYSGGLTTCEAFIMGVPVVTLPGPTFAGRHSATHLVNAGMPELVVNSWEEYRARVIGLASDLDSLGTIRQHLRNVLLQSPVCDGPRFAKHFTDAMRAIWQRYCDDKAPAALTLNKEGEARFEDEDAPVEIHYAEAPEDESTFQWQFEGKIIAVDNGGQLLESDVVRQLLQKEVLELIAFDPSSQALDTSLKQYKGVHYYPNATLGDGQPGHLHACLDPKLSASLAPLGDEYQPEAIRKGSQVLTRLPLNTIALDSIQGLPAIDWLILDALNDAAAIFDNGAQALKDTLLLQVKVAFQPTHERQPNLAEIQHWASRHGFRFYRLHEPQHRSHLPADIPETQRQATELTSADALLLPSHARMEALSDNQRTRLAFLLHTVYGLHDLASQVLIKMDQTLGNNYLIAQGYLKPERKPAPLPLPRDLAPPSLLTAKGRKGRFVHICFNNMHVQPLVKLLQDEEASAGFVQHILIGKARSIPGYDVDISMNPDAFYFDERQQLEAVLEQCLQQDVIAIFFHGLFFDWQKQLVERIGKQKKTIWVMWGGDLYNPIKSQSLMTTTVSCLSFVATWWDRDYEIFAQNYEKKERVNFGGSIATDFANIPLPTKKEKTIFVGNSGDPENQHIEILKNLATKKDIADYNIIIPVAYNLRPDYLLVLKKEVKNLNLNSQVSYIEKLLPIESYFALLAKAEFFLTAHQRQQGGGNLTASLYYGNVTVLRKKILLNGSLQLNPIWKQYHDDMDLPTISLEEFYSASRISDFQVSDNVDLAKQRERINIFRGRDSVKSLISNSFIQLNN